MWFRGRSSTRLQLQPLHHRWRQKRLPRSSVSIWGSTTYVYFPSKLSKFCTSARSSSLNGLVEIGICPVLESGSSLPFTSRYRYSFNLSSLRDQPNHFQNLIVGALINWSNQIGKMAWAIRNLLCTAGIIWTCIASLICRMLTYKFASQGCCRPPPRSEVRVEISDFLSWLLCLILAWSANSTGSTTKAFYVGTSSTWSKGRWAVPVCTKL